MSARRLMAVLAHPDDESLGFGDTLAKHGSEGADVEALPEIVVRRGRALRPEPAATSVGA